MGPVAGTISRTARAGSGDAARFVEVMCGLLESEANIVATVAKKGGGFISEIKDRPGVRIIELTRTNQQRVVDEIAGLLRH